MLQSKRYLAGPETACAAASMATVQEDAWPSPERAVRSCSSSLCSNSRRFWESRQGPQLPALLSASVCSVWQLCLPSWF